MRAAGKTISFDPNLRPTLWPSREAMVESLNALAALADWVLPGVSEGLDADRLHEAGGHRHVSISTRARRA